MFNAPPGIDRRRYQTKRQKLLTFATIVPLSIVALISGVNVVINIIVMLMGAIAIDQTAVVVTLLVAATFAISAVGLFYLLRLYRRPLQFGVELTNIPPTVQGHPFAVRFRQNPLGASFRRRGVVQFLPDQLIVEGPREIKIYLQVAVILALIVLPNVPIVPGVAFFWAVAIAVSLIGRKKQVQVVPYQAIRRIRQKGRRIHIDCPGLKPSKLVFAVDVADGQRLSGEIQPRFGALGAGS